MSNYVKISYPSQSQEVNRALIECIMYIGKNYGNNNDNLLKSGVAYLAKKVRGASKRSIRMMIYSRKIKNYHEREWLFKKKTYARVYRYIFYKMIEIADTREERPLALELLSRLYRATETKRDKTLISDVVVPLQKEMLTLNLNVPSDKSERDTIKDILKTFQECDKKYILN